MKQLKRFSRTVFILLFSLAFSLMFFSCENSDPVSASISNIEKPAAQKQLNFLKLKHTTNTLNKKKRSKKWVTKTQGGNLHLKHGTASGAEANSMYAVNLSAPYNVYKVDPANPDNPVLVGQLAFSSGAIALHPENGKIYYLGSELVNGVYQVGVMDPETNTNAILPGGSSFKPAKKLAFRPDGTLFGVKSYDTNKLYTIDITSGVWTLYTNLTQNLQNSGDMAFSPDGQSLYSVGGQYARLKVTDVASGSVMALGKVGQRYVRGLCFGDDGQLYYGTKNGRIGIVDQSTGVGSIIGSTGLAKINDLAPVIAATELSFAEVSLDILPGAVDADVEIEVNLETTELVGGVAMTFSPHGTVFNTPAILNIEAHGVDFTGVDPNAIDIFYDNQETGQWEPMPRDQIIVDVISGIIRVINAQLPHFSRYALAAD